MKLLLIALLLPLVYCSLPIYEKAKKALQTFLRDRKWHNFGAQFECNHDSFYNGGFDPDHGIWEQMSKLDPKNLTITRLMYIDDTESLILFYVPAVSRFFTVTTETEYLFIARYLLTNYQYYCPALAIAQVLHKRLAVFSKKHDCGTFDEQRKYVCEHKWETSHLYNPMIYQEEGKPERLIDRDNCTLDNGDLLMERTRDDQILGASFVEGSKFAKIKYTAVSFNRLYIKYGMITEFTLLFVGSRYEYIHMKDLGKHENT